MSNVPKWMQKVFSFLHGAASRVNQLLVAVLGEDGAHKLVQDTVTGLQTLMGQICMAAVAYADGLDGKTGPDRLVAALEYVATECQKRGLPFIKDLAAKYIHDALLVAREHLLTPRESPDAIKVGTGDKPATNPPSQGLTGAPADPGSTAPPAATPPTTEESQGTGAGAVATGAPGTPHS